MTGGAVGLIGDFYHKAAPMSEALGAACAELGVSLYLEDDPKRFPWKRLDEFGLIIVAREARVRPTESDEVWTNDEYERAIVSRVRAGASLAVIHAGLASYDPNGPFVEATRGYFLMHPAEHPVFTVSAVRTDHPIVDGSQSFSIQDEMYFVRVDSKKTQKLFEARNEDYGSSCAGWAHTFGSGRVFCYTPGHTERVLADPSYRAVLVKGLRWLVELP